MCVYEKGQRSKIAVILAKVSLPRLGYAHTSFRYGRDGGVAGIAARVEVGCFARVFLLRVPRFM